MCKYTYFSMLVYAGSLPYRLDARQEIAWKRPNNAAQSGHLGCDLQLRQLPQALQTERHRERLRRHERMRCPGRGDRAHWRSGPYTPACADDRVRKSDQKAFLPSPRLSTKRVTSLMKRPRHWKRDPNRSNARAISGAFLTVSRALPPTDAVRSDRRYAPRGCLFCHRSR